MPGRSRQCLVQGAANSIGLAQASRPVLLSRSFAAARAALRSHTPAPAPHCPCQQPPQQVQPPAPHAITPLCPHSYRRCCPPARPPAFQPPPGPRPAALHHAAPRFPHARFLSAACVRLTDRLTVRPLFLPAPSPSDDCVRLPRGCPAVTPSGPHPPAIPSPPPPLPPSSPRPTCRSACFPPMLLTCMSVRCTSRDTCLGTVRGEVPAAAGASPAPCPAASVRCASAFAAAAAAAVADAGV